MLKKIISGAQTGADVAGLKAAKACGIPTGGYMTKGCKTLDGPRPEYLTLYNMTECDSANYPTRTWLNVKKSDGTLRFASNWKSPGELCTANAIAFHKKPKYDVDLVDLNSPELWTEEEIQKEINKVREWINTERIEVLNVAGNSERSSPGIEDFVYK